MTSRRQARPDAKVVILCGGKGTRMGELAEASPKPMVRIGGGEPILWHVMQLYASRGFKDFVLCLGWKGDVIRDYFLRFAHLHGDVTVELGKPGAVEVHRPPAEADWRVTLVDTGLDSMTGARVKAIEKYVDGSFFLTYGDGLSDLDIPATLRFHRKHGMAATVTGVHPIARFGELDIQGDQVTRFMEKPQTQTDFINGGFYVFEPDAFDYLSKDPGCVLERQPLERMASDGQLMVYKHRGYWQCMDTPRDLEKLSAEWVGGKAPWKVW